jgi:hypothetical protein
MSLVDSKITIEYNQVFIGEEVVRRFAVMDVNYVTTSNYQEVLYDDLTNQEKIIFDTFYISFSS